MNDRTNLNPVLVSVCVATYNREQLLKKLLESLLNQKLDNNISLEIVIADNNPEGSAKSIVEEFLNNNRIKIKYFIQPEKNISLTRNVCLQNAEGDYIAFIDDDETADEYWLKNFLSCLTTFKADGAFGYVEPVFDKRIPLKLQKREYYFSPINETGSSAKFFFTTNAIVRTSLINSEKIAFDPSYGLTGGEDVHLFERLKRKGATFIYCKEAITYEFIPFERGNLRYLYNRAQRGGQSYTRRKLEFNRNYKYLLFIKLIIKIFLLIFYLPLNLISHKWRVKFIIFIGSLVGQIRGIFKLIIYIYK